MSRFIDLMEKAGQQAPSPMGFTRHSGGPDMAPQIVLAARLRADDLKKEPGLAEANAEAFLVAPSDEDTELSAVAESLGEQLWGVRLVQFSAAQANQLMEKGCDFIVFESMETEAAVLNKEDLGKIVTLGPDLGEEVIRSACELPVDGILFSPVRGTLTVGSLVNIQRVRGITDKPFIVEAPEGLSQGDLEALRNLGVNGLIVDLTPLDKIEEVKGMIDSLPRRRPRRGHRDGVVPNVAAQTEGDLPGPDEEDYNEEANAELGPLY